jgi:hypothetical protein
MKTTWNIIKSVTGRKINKSGIQLLNIDGKLTDNHRINTDALYDYEGESESKGSFKITNLVPLMENKCTCDFSTVMHFWYSSLSFFIPSKKKLFGCL